MSEEIKALTIPNFTMSPIHCAVCHAYAFKDAESGLYRYKPLVCFILNDDKEKPLVINLFLDVLYDSYVELATEVVGWLNKAINNVSKMVTVLDSESGEIITKCDVMDILRRDQALEELKLIHRTDTTVIQ